MRFRGSERVAALVHPGVDREAVQAPGAGHELPHADGFRPAYRGVRKTALDQAEVEEVLREPLGAKPLADHPLVAAQPGEPDLEPIARVDLEELEVLEHAPIRGEARDVDVEGRLGRRRRADHGATLGAEQALRLALHLFSLDGRRRGRPAREAVGPSVRAMQAVEHLLVGGGILLGPGRERPDRVRAARGGRVGTGRRVGRDGSQRAGADAARPAARDAQRAAQRRAQQREQSNPCGFHHRVAK